MTYRLEYTEKALEDLASLDRQITKRITQKLEFFISQQNPLRFAERLTDAPVGHYRFRIGDYRALFDIKPNGTISILLILRVKHRREAYA